jgi:uncharacterized protein DUF6325
MEHGPLEVLVFTFPGDVDPASVTPAIREVVEAGFVTVVDLVLLLRDASGELDLRDLEDDLSPELEWLKISPHTLLNDEDIAVVAETLPDDQQAALLVIEHAWAKGAAERLDAAGAELALYARVPAFEAEMAFAAS